MIIVILAHRTGGGRGYRQKGCTALRRRQAALASARKLILSGAGGVVYACRIARERKLRHPAQLHRPAEQGRPACAYPPSKWGPGVLAQQRQGSCASTAQRPQWPQQA